MSMKALILAGGRGKRLDELSENNNKCMIEVNGKPTVEYSLDCAAINGIDDLVVVVGYRAEDIINHYGISYKGKSIRYVIQPEQRGLVHAIECAKGALGSSDFMLLLGDEIMLNPRHGAMIEAFYASDVFSLCGVLWVEDKNLIKRTYTMICDSDNVIYRLVEKPQNPLSNYMGTGDIVFKNSILKFIDVTPIHHERNEKELPDLIQCAIDDGEVVKMFDVCDRYSNINSKGDIAMAEEFLK